MQRISDAEMEVMRVFWSGNGPMGSAQIQEGLDKDCSWKATTLLTFLSRLCDKGFLRVERLGKSNVWQPLITQEEYRRMETQAFLNEVHHGSMKSLIAALDSGDVKPEELQALKEWFEHI